MNLCPLCKNSHDKSHFITEYENKYFFCKNHYEMYISYCDNCKKDICTLCEKMHANHKLIAYGSIIPDLSKFEEKNKEFKEKVSNYKNYIKAIISKLNYIIENLESYYNIYSTIINNFNIRNRNYSIIQNINYMNSYNNNFKNKIEQIINDESFRNTIDDIIEIIQNKEEAKTFSYLKDTSDGGPLIFDDGNIICNIVDQNLIIQYKDKKMVIMTTELIKKKDEETKNRLIKDSIRVNLAIQENLYLFDKNPIKYFNKLKEYLNKNGDLATTEFDQDEGVKYYCLITRKNIKEINEFNDRFCELRKEEKGKSFWWRLKLKK